MNAAKKKIKMYETLWKVSMSWDVLSENKNAGKGF